MKFSRFMTAFAIIRPHQRTVNILSYLQDFVNNFLKVFFKVHHAAIKKQVTLLWLAFETGNVLLSRAVPRQVSSALGSLTSVCEMGTGVSSPLLSPDSSIQFIPLSPNNVHLPNQDLLENLLVKFSTY